MQSAFQKLLRLIIIKSAICRANSDNLPHKVYTCSWTLNYRNHNKNCVLYKVQRDRGHHGSWHYIHSIYQPEKIHSYSPCTNTAVGESCNPKYGKPSHQVKVKKKNHTFLAGKSERRTNQNVTARQRFLTRMYFCVKCPKRCHPTTLAKDTLQHQFSLTIPRGFVKKIFRQFAEQKYWSLRGTLLKTQPSEVNNWKKNNKITSNFK